MIFMEHEEVRTRAIGIVQQAVELVAGGQVESGALLLDELDGEALKDVFYARLESGRHAPILRGVGRSRVRGPSKKLVFSRDRYHCRYCGIQTIDPDIWPA